MYPKAAPQAGGGRLRVRNASLSYCIRERIDPADFARAVEGRPGYVIPNELHLAHVIAADWPLRLVYQACALTGI
jgi:hypothetical protein